MPQFILRWANRGTSTQHWQVFRKDEFTLPQDYVRPVTVTITNDYTFNVAVVTESAAIAVTKLTYSAAGNQWMLDTTTPNEWQLAQGNGFVTVRCLLSDAAIEEEFPGDYDPVPPEQAAN